MSRGVLHERKGTDGKGIERKGIDRKGIFRNAEDRKRIDRKEIVKKGKDRKGVDRKGIDRKGIERKGGNTKKERKCKFSQEKMKSQSPVCHQKQQSRHTNSMDVKTILTQRGIDTLGLLLLYEM